FLGKVILSLLLCFTLFLIQLLQLYSAIVEHLPGFQDPLPFEMETGYIGFGESEEVQLFYYFVKSEKNPEEDPIMIWLTGGPSCSSLSAFFFENGPLNFAMAQYNGDLPRLIVNPESWTKVTSIIYLDSPVGTGFSYNTTLAGSITGDFEASKMVYQFITKWMIDHPQFLTNPFYMGGNSYSGKIVPVVTQEISDGNEAGIQPYINLKGYVLGNPVTDPFYDINKVVPFAHGMGLIPNELYESLQSNCGGEYVVIDPSNVECLEDMKEFKKDDEYLLLDYWANIISVRKALQIREGSIEKWRRCHRSIPYTFAIESSVKYHVNLSKKGYRSLIYSGDHDMVASFLATQAWIKSLNYSIVDEWRPWFVDGQVGGYTRTYSNHMTYATVKGGGHEATAYKPKESFAMFKRWMMEEPLLKNIDVIVFGCAGSGGSGGDIEGFFFDFVGDDRGEVREMGGAKKLLLCFTLFLIQLLQLHSAIVKHLPGFQGPLPFQMETGYIGFGESEEVQLFYYFVKSEKNPKEDPIMIWLTGGPSCSSLSAFFFGNGPLNFAMAEYNGDLPRLIENPESWTKVTSIIYLDSLVGTGFSYNTTLAGFITGDFEASKMVYQFITKWMIDHPQFLMNPFYVAGNSYSGKIVPVVTQEISDGNEAGIQPYINLKGYVLGNPVTDPFYDSNKQVPFAHGMGLIPNELHERNCGGEYVEIDPNNVKCLEDMKEFKKCTSRLNSRHILQPVCDVGSPRPNMMVRDRRSLGQISNEFLDLKLSLTELRCLDYEYLSMDYWVNIISVRKALQIRELRSYVTN
ncbi:serine carboxypeptidase-like 13, partial [Telopea speciosissima]|uniref:serine carboxypeptidase-like 13 n=1 Tax=Telopea speciosissima TaxID=54955 RepID=UPI001CC67CD2